MEEQGVLTKPPEKRCVEGWAGDSMGGVDQGLRSHLFSQPPPPQRPELTAAALGGLL